MDHLDNIFLRQTKNEFASPYRPSIFICCILIFWTIIAMVAEVIIPELAFGFTLTTYGPTIHFGMHSIISTVRGSHTKPEHVKSDAKRAMILTIIWLLTIAAHFGLWWSERSGYAGIFLNGVVPGSQSALIILYIALRYVLHRRSREQSERIQLPDEDEASDRSAQTEALPAEDSGPSSAEDIVESAEAPSVVSNIYQPSIQLLVLSILLTIFTTVTDILKNDLWFQIIAVVQTHAPTFLIHLFILTSIIRRRTQTPEELSAIAGLTFEITLCWLWTRLLIIVVGILPLYSALFIPGVAETALMIYFSLRYTRSLRKASTEQYKKIHTRLLLDHTVTAETSSNLVDADVTADAPALDIYHPSIFLLAGIILSGACILIEAPREPAVAPMSVLVYAPTIFVYSILIVQRWRHTYINLKKYEKATERSIQLTAIWVLTHAFYLFVWPVNQYLKKKVMDPYVRWSAVGIAVYISSRYILDGKLRAGRSQGIGLPPDDRDSILTTTQRPDEAGGGV